MNFEEALEKGRRAEQLIASRLMRLHYSVLPVYDFSGLSENKAPKLAAFPGSRSLIMPDLFVALSGKSCWVEVKQKDEATLYRKTNVLETGINLRLWNDYVSVQKTTGLSVWIIFVHESEDEIRAASLDRLQGMKREYHGHRMGRGGMAFFPYAALTVISRLSTERNRQGAVQ